MAISRAKQNEKNARRRWRAETERTMSLFTGPVISELCKLPHPKIPDLNYADYVLWMYEHGYCNANMVDTIHAAYKEVEHLFSEDELKELDKIRRKSFDYRTR